MNCKSSSRSASARSIVVSDNLTLFALREAVVSVAGKPVYAYVVRSVSMSDGTFLQGGCGPNWEGGLITLCTCKHRVRTYNNPAEWPGYWIAGFTSREAPFRSHFLVYLMQVGHAFESFAELWTALPLEARSAKAAHLSPIGDVYEPIMERMVDPASRFDPANYEPPVLDHVHADDSKWLRDIDYVFRGKRPSLLVGDPQLSFVWAHPVVGLADLRLPRDCKRWSSTQSLLSDLVDCRGTARHA